MRILRYWVFVAAMVLPFSFAQAQVSVNIGVGVGIAPPVGYVYYGPAPVCPWGYYPYYPYGCAPYGYYGPSWFINGVFIGAGPWYGGYWGRGYFGVGYRGYGYWGGYWRARYYENLQRRSIYNPGGYSYLLQRRPGLGMRGILSGYHGIAVQHGFHGVRPSVFHSGVGNRIMRPRSFGASRFAGVRVRGWRR